MAAMCFDCISLLFYFPPVHHLLGKALYQLKNFNESAKALELFLTMNHNHVKARQMLISIYDDYLFPDKNVIYNRDQNHYHSETQKSDTETIHISSEQENGSKSLKHKIFLSDKKQDLIYIVSGLPRSGTSMMMQILFFGGAEILTDEKRKADKHNQHGYYEFEPVKKIRVDNSWLSMTKGKHVKIIAQNLFYLPPTFHYKVIFMKRNLTEIIHSQEVMLNKITSDKKIDYPLLVVESYKSVLQKIDLLAAESNFEFIFLDYSDILENPERNIDKLLEFTGLKLEKNKMIQAIDKKSYRSKLHNLQS